MRRSCSLRLMSRLRRREQTSCEPDGFTLMNYGYAPLDRDADGDGAHGEALPERLYRHVAGAVDLAGKSLLEVGSGRGGGLAHVKRALGPRVAFGVELSPRAVAL